ncbi:Thiamine-phosphate synthase [Desulfovibrionales bacterium]
MRPIPDLSVYLVADRSICRGRDLIKVVTAAVAGGVTMVQLRDKHANTQEFLALARQLKSVLAGTGIPLIVNDRVDIALAAGINGLHIGQTDLPYLEARRLLGIDAIIGLSLDHLEDANVAANWDVDYLSAGPIFATITKSDAGPPLGLAGLASFRAATHHRLVAIGAITAASACIQAGANGVAVASAICAAPDPAAAARVLREATCLPTRPKPTQSEFLWSKKGQRYSTASHIDNKT